MFPCALRRPSSRVCVRFLPLALSRLLLFPSSLLAFLRRDSSTSYAERLRPESLLASVFSSRVCPSLLSLSPLKDRRRSRQQPDCERLKHEAKRAKETERERMEQTLHTKQDERSSSCKERNTLSRKRTRRGTTTEQALSFLSLVTLTRLSSPPVAECE